MVERKLNLDIAGAVSELEMLIQRVFPRNIVYRLILGKGLEFDGFRNLLSKMMHQILIGKQVLRQKIFLLENILKKEI